VIYAYIRPQAKYVGIEFFTIGAPHTVDYKIAVSRSGTVSAVFYRPAQLKAYFTDLFNGVNP